MEQELLQLQHERVPLLCCFHTHSLSLSGKVGKISAGKPLRVCLALLPVAILFT